MVDNVVFLNDTDNVENHVPTCVYFLIANDHLPYLDPCLDS